jgi:hypothetical protein
VSINRIKGAYRIASENPELLGVDFTSAPSRRKPIAVAVGHWHGDHVKLARIEYQTGFDEFEAMLARPGPWVGAFDMPFGLPREFVETVGWPTDWAACIRHYAAQPREQLRDAFKAFCDARPVGNKFAHRATDRPAGSSPSMKWVNPPVAWMLHVGAIRLINAGVDIPCLQKGDSQRIALEAYPGLLARSVTRASYKSDTRAKQTVERQGERERIVSALQNGDGITVVPLELTDQQRAVLIDDASGDSLDAVICLVQAAWAISCGDGRLGLPDDVDPLEGWILGAGVENNGS